MSPAPEGLYWFDQHLFCKACHFCTECGDCKCCRCVEEGMDRCSPNHASFARGADSSD